MRTLLAIFLSSFLLTGCLSPEEMRDNEIRRARMSPLDTCIEKASFDTGICLLGAMSVPNAYEKRQRQQQCSDREMAMQDRCYARFK